MGVAQKVKEAEITEQDSLLLTRNLLRIAIFNISYIRGLFPEKYFNDKSVPALEMKIKKLMPMDAESRRLIDWMEKGVYDALQKRYLKTLLFCICESAEGHMIEEYSCKLLTGMNQLEPYGETDEFSMNITRKQKGGAFRSNRMEITPNHMRSSACKMIRTLVQLMKTLDCMPAERTILMKLLYYEDSTPSDYEPPFFRSCTEQEANISWMKNPLKMEVGNVNSKHILLALKVKSVLDPCEDEDDVMEDGDVSLGEDSVQDGSYSSGSERQHSAADQYVVMPIEDDGVGSDDDTQDPDQDEVELSSVRKWLVSRETDTIDLVNVMSDFPSISTVLIKEIIEKLIQEGVLTVVGKDVYAINKTKKLMPNIDHVKEEMDDAEMMKEDATSKTGEDHRTYMEALYHALPLEYVTITKLRKKLKGNTSLHTVRKLVDKMTLEGFLEAKSNGKLGKRVIHSEAADRKFEEVKRALDMEMEIYDNSLIKSNPTKFPSSSGCKENEESICGGLHSIGSDITRSLGKYVTNCNQTAGAKGKNPAKATPSSKMQLPAASRESAVPAANVKCLLVPTTMESRSTQEKRIRKASMVKDPISQLVKRLKVHAAT